MLLDYMQGEYDLVNSYVIGDRETDLQLAENLGCKSVFYSLNRHRLADFSSTDWHAIARFLLFPDRESVISRNTNETKISIHLNLDGRGEADINTGLGFFDHMLHQIAKHAACDLTIRVDGDLHVDEHHTIEDTAIALGDAFSKALGDKRGMNRYGFLLPMDDSLAQVALDFGGRAWLVWQAGFKREKVGDMPTEMFYHFFKSFSDASKCNLNIKAEGDNEHHKIEAIFKAVAKCIKMAVQRNEQEMNNLPSTKGLL
jgi:imidazoleglycerol-phosphate dehydratase/histidinol-phosphatase